MILVATNITACKNKIIDDFSLSRLYERYELANYDKIEDALPVQSVQIFVSYPQVIGHCITEDPEYSMRQMERIRESIKDLNAFRNSCDVLINLKDDMSYYIFYQLIDAKEVDKDKIKPRKMKKDTYIGLQGGMIIDINFENGDTESYIMDNDGKYLFYKKSEPDKFYKMPKVILDAFYENIKFKNPRGLVFKTFVLR